MQHYFGSLYRKKEQGPFFCKCGQQFKRKQDLKVHIALLNPHWPRVSVDDLHVQVFSRPLQHAHQMTGRRLTQT